MRPVCATPLLFAALVALAVPAGAVERRLTLVNETSFAIAEFYASNVGKEGWGENRIVDQPLPAGSTVQIDLDDGTGYCMFNLRAVFDDGDEIVSEGINICDEGRFYYRP